MALETPSRASVGARAKKVLIVEDNADVRDMLRTSLELGGHVVRTAHDGPSAIALCEDWTPDVALVDIGLPGMDGYELARALRQTKCCSNVTLVAVTGYAASSDRARAKEAGFDAHVSKPVDPQILESVLEGRAPAPRP